MPEGSGSVVPLAVCLAPSRQAPSRGRGCLGVEGLHLPTLRCALFVRTAERPEGGADGWN
jgi:hypothetical protein